MGYTTIESFIKTLINNSNSPITTVDNFKNITQTSSIMSNHQNFWLDFLTYLKNEKNSAYIGIAPIRQSTLQGTSSIMEYINNLADLDDDIYTEVADLIKENTSIQSNGGYIFKSNSNMFWNESINELIAYFIANFEKRYNEDQPKRIRIIHDGDKIYYVEDLVNADAGNSFEEDFSNSAPAGEWVIPWTNYNDQSFYTVEKTQTVINGITTDTAVDSNIKIQYTRGLVDNAEWIRLLMPQNNRRVEVIDLNRNFWVIAQAVGPICAYLFDDNSPIVQMFKKISNEILQQWENILYLWIALAEYCTAASSHIVVKYLQIPTDEYNVNRHYDSQTTSTSTDYSQSSIIKKFDYLIHKYPKRNLIVIPYYYGGYTERDIHATINFPCILFHKANTSNFIYTKLLNNINGTNYNVQVSARATSSSTSTIGLADKTFGMYKYNNLEARYSNYNFNSLSGLEDSAARRYYNIIRITPSTTASLTDDNEIQVNLNIVFTDVVSKCKDDSTRVVHSFNCIANSSMSEVTITNSARGTIANSQAKNNYKDGDIVSSYYIGECLSSHVTTIGPTFDYEVTGHFLPPLAEETPFAVTSPGQQRNKDTQIIDAWLNKHASSSERDYHYKLWMLTGCHCMGAYHKDGVTGGNKWWYIDVDNGNSIYHSPIELSWNDYKTVWFTGAGIYNPLTREPINNYQTFSYYEPNDIGTPKTLHRNSSGDISFIHRNTWRDITTSSRDEVNAASFFYVKSGENLSSGNWFIRQVRAFGAYTWPMDPYEEDKNGKVINPGNTVKGLKWSNGNPMYFHQLWQPAYSSQSDGNFFVTNPTPEEAYQAIRDIYTQGEKVYSNQTIYGKIYTDSTSSVAINTDHAIAYWNIDYNNSKTHITIANKNLSQLYYQYTYMIQVDLFGPYNQHECIIYKRKPYEETIELHGTGMNLQSFAGTGDNIEDWKIEYETKNYAKTRKMLSNSYEIQDSKAKYLAKTVSGEKKDFEISKRTGVVTEDMIQDNFTS